VGKRIEKEEKEGGVGGRGNFLRSLLGKGQIRRRGRNKHEKTERSRSKKTKNLLVVEILLFEWGSSNEECGGGRG